MNFQLGELFCGPGGMALGALNASKKFQQTYNRNFQISHAWANDIDQNTCQTYINNITPHDATQVYCQDVRTLDIPALPSIDGLAVGSH